MIEFFILIFAVISIYSVFTIKKINNILFWGPIILLTLLDGLKWNMGTDWDSYLEAFNLANEQIPIGFEIGFATYMKLFRELTDNYSIFLLVTTAFFYIGVFSQIFKLTNRNFLSIYFLMGTLPWYSGALRQMMALVFFVLVLKACLNRNILNYFLFLIIAALFHTTTLFFFFIYFIYGFPILLFCIFYISFFLLIYIFRSQLLILAKFSEQYGNGKDYTDFFGGSISEGQGSPLLGFLRKIYTYFFLIFGAKNIIKNTSNTIYIKQIQFLSFLSLFSIITFFIGTYFIAGFSSRVDIYVGIICTAILIGLIDNSIKKKLHRFLFFLFITSLIVFNYIRLDHMYLFHPYSSIFYNKDIIR
jgi:hypothetical protein